jgi:hypothetical protein
MMQWHDWQGDPVPDYEFAEILVEGIEAGLELQLTDNNSQNTGFRCLFS